MSFQREVSARRRRLRRPLSELVLATVAAAYIVAVHVWPRVWPRIDRMFGMSHEQFARAAVNEYAFAAYPHWRAAHPGGLCPESLAVLTADGTPWRRDTIDPWGSQYWMLCGTAPDGTGHIVVHSMGEDRVSGTADDIWSFR